MMQYFKIPNGQTEETNSRITQVLVTNFAYIYSHAEKNVFYCSCSIHVMVMLSSC